MQNDDTKRGWIAWMARNPVAANLLMVVLVVGGLATTFTIRQEFFPEYDLDTIQITAPYPGSTPTDVEEGILLAIEEQVRGLDGVKEVQSTASEGMGTVVVELLIGTDNNRALQDVKNAVDRITSFPDEIERLTVSLQTMRSKVIDLVIYGGDEMGAYGDQREHVLRDLADAARDQLLHDRNITLAELSGVRPLEIGVEVPQAELRRYGLTLGQIADKIRRTALEVPGGGVKTKSGEILLRTAERRDVASEFKDIPLVTAPDGSSVRVGDIAAVTDGFADTDQSSYYNGMPAAIVQVYRVGDQTPIQVADAVKKFAREFGAGLPPGVYVATQDDMSELYRDRINLLLRNAMFGLVLVLITLGIFLELRLAFWVTLGIPVSFLGAMLLLPGTDVSINMISLFAFIMALGMVVDDAIVVGENIYEMRQRGVPFLTAAIKGARQIFVPVVFSVLTNMVAFAPMLFVPGFAGKIFRVIPAVIIPVFFISLVESLFILPCHLGHTKEHRTRGAFAFFGRQQARLSQWLERCIHGYYGALVRATLRWRYLTIACGFAVLILTVGFIAGGRINVSFMPNVAADFATASLRLPYGCPVEMTKAAKDRIVKAAYDVLDSGKFKKLGGADLVRGVQSTIGSNIRRGGPGSITGGRTGGNSAVVRVNFKPERIEGFSTTEFAKLWRKRVGEIPGAETFTVKSDMGPGRTRAPIDVKLSHRDVPALERAATELADRLKEFAGIKDIDSGFSPGKPERDFTRTEVAEALRIDSAELGNQVRHAFYGAEALRQQRGRDEVKVMVRLPESERRSEYDIEELIIRTSEGGEIPLDEAGKVETKRAYTEINRTDGRRVMDVTADVDPAVTNAQKITAELEKSVLPEFVKRHPGLTYSMEGERRDLMESLQSLFQGFLLALLIIFAMLAVPLRSYIQPLIIMTAIPFGIVGAVLGHVIMGFNISIMSMMGIVALAGVVVNDSLVLICATNDRRTEGASAFDAVSSAGIRRFRPILLTSLTTFFGLAPMIFETSMQARFLVPMAVSLGYGVLLATSISLLLVPSLYLIVSDITDILPFLKRKPAEQE